MARLIALREEYLGDCDDATLQTVTQALRQEFLFISLDHDRIEVDEQDYAAIDEALQVFKRDLNSDR